MAPGILYVTMSPSPSLSSSDFHNWYNNEHGPLRLRLHPLVTNGFRYRAADLDTPAPPSSSTTTQPQDGNAAPRDGAANAKHEWMAIYDLPNVGILNEPAYLKLRDDPVQSQRERDLRPSIKINRRDFVLVQEYTQDNTASSSSTFRPLESLSPENKEDNVLVAACVTLKPDTPNAKETFEDWFNTVHIPMLKRVPGWLRCRRFVTTPGSGSNTIEYLSLHEYTSLTSLTTPAYKAASTDPRTKETMQSCIATAERRTWARYYTFGPAPRDLAAVASAPKSFENTSAFARCRTFPPSETSHSLPAIESYVQLSDGTILPYRLEGSTDPDAQTIVLSNSILTTWGIWDGFVSAFFSPTAPKQNHKFRILRYNARGRYAPAPSASSSKSKPVTVDLLAADLVELLDALRIKKTAAAIGVSLGGATTLAAALKWPDRFERFMACDTSAKSPEGNAKAWSERIEMAEREGATRTENGKSLQNISEEIAAHLDVLREGEKVVGQELAEATTGRWFAPSNLQKAEPGRPESYDRIKAMVSSNSLAGFKSTVQALWEYDYTPLLGSYEGKGRFLVGGEDGKLPESMPKMAEKLGVLGGGKAECVIIGQAGHLPMVEKPGEVAREVGRLLEW